VVSSTFEVTAYRTLWSGLQYDSETIEQGETVGNGALTTVRWYDGEPVGDSHLQGQFAAFKDVGGNMIDKDVFTRRRRDGIWNGSQLSESGIERSCVFRLVNHLRGGTLSQS